ncbi:MAG TPA: hypothetical protein DD389_05465 [Candidatus Marinimicrobia bacterium]|jgi:UDP-perosamine 4-acetyltransferase|nr:hypothetical protein [Candidatus Neomarinimicrobiota bacterium]
MENIIVFGAGEFGTLVTNVLSYIDQYQIVAFGDDDRQKAGQTLAGLPVFSTVDIFEFAETKKITTAIMAIGNNRARAEKYELFKNRGFKLISIIHPQALIDTAVTFGDNVIIEMGTAIHTHSTIGNNVFLGGDALIGHHNIIGDNVLVGGNASFGGSVIVDDYATIGVGSAIKPGVHIGANAVVGVGAAVVQDVPENAVVVGVPAKQISENKT